MMKSMINKANNNGLTMWLCQIIIDGPRRQLSKDIKKLRRIQEEQKPGGNIASRSWRRPNGWARRLTKMFGEEKKKNAVEIENLITLFVWLFFVIALFLFCNKTRLI